jgi:hypothetical protein
MSSRPSLDANATTPVPKRLASLIFNFVRARVMRVEWEKEDRKLRRKINCLPKDAALSIGDLGRWLTFFSLWLACLQVVVEGYEESMKDPRSLLYDARIQELLEDSNRARELKRYRNKVFHPEPYDHSHLSAVQRKYHEFASWAADLTDQFDRVFTEKLGSL